jgi:hypothetical protein
VPKKDVLTKDWRRLYNLCCWLKEIESRKARYVARVERRHAFKNFVGKFTRSGVLVLGYLLALRSQVLLVNVEVRTILN